MKPTQFYPVIQTDNVEGTASFYSEHFGFRAVFTSDWYIHLQSEADPAVNIAVLDGYHETVPESGRGLSKGVILNFEVPDAKADYLRLTSQGLPVLKDLCDEDFGQRHFITADPNGVLIDVITPIPPSGSYVEQYTQDALPV